MIGPYIEEGRQKLIEKGIRTIAVRGTESGHAVTMNRDYIDSIAIEMRTADAPETVDTSWEFLGKSFSTPVMPAALSHLTDVRPDGMEQVAAGTAAAGSCMWSGIGSTQQMERLIATGAPLVKIVKPYKDEDLIMQKLKDAEANGCLAVGMDVCYYFGAQIGDMLWRPDLCSPKSSADLRRYIEATKLPFVVKGVLSVTDAKQALELGAAAIVVSNHSGNIIDYAVPPMRILPDIVKAVDGKMQILIDGDICRGTDVFKAIALGADGALVGRPLMAGLELDGAEGVTKVIQGITDEMKRVMHLTGCAKLEDIRPDILWMP